MYIISLEYGQWGDTTSKDIYVHADPTKATEQYVKLLARIRDIVAKVRDAFVYNGEHPYRMLSGSGDKLEQILSMVYDDDVTVVLSHMEEGVLTEDRTRVSSQWIELFSYPEVDTVPEIDDNDLMTKFESLALGFERQHYGWRIH